MRAMRRMTDNKNRIRTGGYLLLALAALVVFYILVPGRFSTYTITVMNGALIYYIANLGTALMLGQCGLVSFAAVVFMGIGGYTSAILSSQYGFPVLASMLTGIAVSMAAAWLLGMALMRLSGTFFTFSTIALVQIGYTIFNGWKKVTGGPNGLPQIPAFRFGGWTAGTYYDNYYVLITMCVLAVCLALRLKKTNLGRAMGSVRDNELVAKTMGINVYQTKIIAFIVAAAFGGFAGAALVHSSHYVVSTYFTFDNATTYVIQVMVGGVYNVFGVFLGTILITMLPEWLRPLQEYIRLVYGVGVMLLMVFMPMGIWGTFHILWKRLRKRMRLRERRTVIGAGKIVVEENV